MIALKAPITDSGATLVDVPTERRLIGALMFEPGVLEQCDELDLDCLHDIRNQHVLVAIREIQLRGGMRVSGAQTWACSVDVEREMADHDKRNEAHVVEQIGPWFFVDLMLEFEPLREPLRVAHDLAWLKTLALRRAHV